MTELMRCHFCAYAMICMLSALEQTLETVSLLLASLSPWMERAIWKGSEGGLWKLSTELYDCQLGNRNPRPTNELGQQLEGAQQWIFFPVKPLTSSQSWLTHELQCGKDPKKENPAKMGPKFQDYKVYV